MKVQFSNVGTYPAPDSLIVEMECVPRVGDTVVREGVGATDSIVRTVVWYPERGKLHSPHVPDVYVVVGRRRPDRLG